MTNRTPLIAGNWKMFKTCPEAIETAAQLVKLLAGAREDIDVMIAPSFTALAPVSDVIKGSCVSLGAQNIFWEAQGAFTGEISPAMLVSAGCKYVIIGHSERRQYFNETDETVNKRIQAAVNNNLIPVMCVGESEKERESKNTFSVLDKQVKKGLEEFSPDDLERLVIAYEPVWAIGTGKTATSDQAQEAHQFLRSVFEKSFGNTLAKSIRILYGGSVKPNNIAELMAMPDVDGALVGGASLDPETFSNIVQFKR
ncbi:MAG: triose-phosphate isomerase [Deltaproteobacteria bacterium]|nr:triose-phosphate isomerase [Deltaproteobacteria bacterium]MBW2012956.1 triose-phosphate isomerase [Deltaproteobacteria bacterium]MBW2088886.1 triose-phosphate isomerase [Deltaproteobacteria bacterium]MBW2320365.1 triose-phosphate isomerase [Deltaproteobacteria bacterium]